MNSPFRLNEKLSRGEAVGCSDLLCAPANKRSDITNAHFALLELIVVANSGDVLPVLLLDLCEDLRVTAADTGQRTHSYEESKGILGPDHVQEFLLVGLVLC